MTYLSDLEPVGGNSRGVDKGTSVSISGVSYPHSVLIFSVSGRKNDLEFNLGKSGGQLLATIGIGDSEDASGLTANISCYVDEKPVKTVEVKLGHPQPLNIGLDSALRVRFVVELEQSISDARSITIAIGDGRYIASR